jgi:hypothetical protein
MEKKVKKLSRKDLVKLFTRGSLPTDKNFEQLIYSNYNKADDKLDITDELGVQMYPVKTGQLLNFFEHPDDEDPEYEVAISSKGLFIQRVTKPHSTDEEKYPELFIEKSSGNMAIGHCEPQAKLDVNGIVASQGRLGNYNEGGLNEIKADGYWHNVFKTNLTGVHAFEIMAFAKGQIGNGKYSILHAIVTCTYGKGRKRITNTRSQFKFKDRIDIRVVSKPSLIERGKNIEPKETGLLKISFRWLKCLFEGKGLDYNVQLRTKSHFGKNNIDPNYVRINYKITLLWGPKTHTN